MRGVANPIFALPIIAAVYIYIMVRSGGVWLPNGRVIAKATSPRSYWTLIGLSVGVLVAVVGFVAFEAFGRP
jgi:hypothetical protein